MKLRQLVLCFTALSGAAAGAAGFEKSIMFGGRSSGVAGIATPYAQGSEALYFNPAGLALDKDGQDVSVNVSPTWAQFKAPLVTNDTTVSSKKKMILPYGLMYGGALSEKLGVGVGIYTSGGTESAYDDVASNGQTIHPKTELAITEAAFGAGYKLSNDLKVGLAYRVVMVSGKISVPTFIDALSRTISSDINGISGTNYLAFKLGAQYKLSEKTQLGFTYRSNSPISAKAKSSQFMNGTQLGSEEDVKVNTTFPDAYTLGVRHNLSDSWNLLGEYVYTAYSRVKNVQLDGKLGTSTNSAIELRWHDQTNLRLAAEYLGMSMPLRFGYVWTSQVTDNQFAKPTMTPPGQAHTVTLGTGKNIGEKMSVDGGLEYTWGSGSGGTSTLNATRQGDYKVTEYALHLGASYSF